ncbi:hypothetical protein [Salisediminibacterium halotolerans]|uniref:hypothetical protein n=1 Tax=Salisediminibacterium halotolerans TaxID=517425 RepID=UPI000EAE75D6|nr:hypothetical protein [Salisediminibacterium halotolerans]RLJ72287.1 hypothetical protein BCL39_2187 [Actinophytocola xinjiangensis]RPE85501.1 hypothetical protein EDD67_2322 [Salisediminibacterium halotolerans]TWG33456.1 hypothetical protein BCL52_2182 [Salisediminibacterium halotolerans]GEL07068.1 hypothetical protein SHA02_04840 [Salisediminibacterium halotolerans]
MNIKPDDYYYAVMRSAMKLPGVRLKREAFLREALKRHVKPQQVETAVASTPADAGIPLKTINKIAKAAIRTETRRVTAISAAAGAPGGFAIAGTLPADLVQYFSHVIRLQQKLIYLYGWEEIASDDGEFDEESLEQLTLFLGVMFGVKSAEEAVSQLISDRDSEAERPQLPTAVLYPVIAKVATTLGYKMSKHIFARGLSKAVPVMGAFTSGGVTYTAFKPLSKRLQAFLKALPIADPKSGRK